jgi:hypothetical protein
MKDLKIYYETDKGKADIDSDFDEFVRVIAKHFGLKFMGSGVTIDTGVRDLHYKKEK